MTEDQAKALALLDRNLVKLENSLHEPYANDFIFAWEAYGLGVKIDNTGYAVAVQHATAVDQDDTRRFLNGKDEVATIVRRRDAIERSLRDAKTTRDAVHHYFTTTGAK